MNMDETIVKFAEYVGYDVWSYSGRFMYGKKCLGITSNDDTIQFITVLGRTLLYDGYFGEYYLDDRVETFLDIIEHMKSDEMGKSTIYYWPQISDAILEDNENIIDEY
jgi:hypothetical protein